MPLRHVLLRHEPDGSWTARCPSLPGCTASGRTRQQALDTLREEMRSYVDTIRAHGFPVPPDDYDTDLLLA